MADYVQDGKIGIDLTAYYASTSAGSTALMPAKPGDRVNTTNNGVYMFARAQSDVSQFDCVIFGPYGDSASLTPTIAAVPITTTNAAAQGYNQIGFYQGVPPSAGLSSYYAWFCLNGMPRVNLLIACNPKVPLYTTSTAGKLDDSTVSAGYVVGVVANTSATSASAPYCVASWPHLLTSNPV